MSGIRTPSGQRKKEKERRKERQKERNSCWVCAEVSIENVFEITNSKTRRIDAEGWLKEGGRLWRR